MTPKPQKVAVIAGFGWSLVNFRLQLLKRMVAQGHEVVAVAPDIDARTALILEENGIRHAHVRMNRTGTNPVADLATLRDLMGLLRRERPDVVLPYTMKPIVYGCMASRLTGIGRAFALFTGLGYAFIDPYPTGRRAMIRAVTIRLHRIGLRNVEAAFTYNPSEDEDIRAYRLVPDHVPLVRVAGSGIDTERFAQCPVPDGPPRFLMVARLLKSKGVAVLADAARLLKAQGRTPDIRLLGPFDSNPDAVTVDEMDRWTSEELFSHLGETRDVRPYLRDASVFVLPTMLREGVPRTILEAMATGRAVITTDAPGCGTTVVEGQTGFVVPQGDAEALAAAMARYLDDSELAAAHGAAGRARAENVYDVHAVNRTILTTIGLETTDEN
ncbi:glycosyltransferase family 4 protein [Oceanomicrobium pacificus]|uniref:Glycosyltransferase n=1 Tax=Oceanomicrobium pacificus TaxID=2692916 RepID=A0A6B0U2F7_9RHOB|nr:glycosyltransferase family 4 protein [Oceanomicrobium pacificus]MXU65201.1 glycosyltransferase [Oceanomicrobium pacificus]